MSARGLGAMMFFFGAGGFVLPFFGLQFKLLNLLGESQSYVAGALAIVGILVMIFGGRS